MIAIDKHPAGFYILSTSRKVLGNEISYRKAYEYELSLGLAFDVFVADSKKELDRIEDKLRKEKANGTSKNTKN